MLRIQTSFFGVDSLLTSEFVCKSFTVMSNILRALVYLYVIESFTQYELSRYLIYEK